MNTLKRFLKNEKGLETVEWTIMAALIVLGAIIAIGALQEAIKGVFSDLATKAAERPTG